MLFLPPRMPFLLFAPLPNSAHPQSTVLEQCPQPRVPDLSRWTRDSLLCPIPPVYVCLLWLD